MARKYMKNSKTEECILLSDKLKSLREEAILAINSNDLTNAREELNIIEEHLKEYSQKCILYS